MTIHDRLTATASTRIGLGLAAVGRPAYINIGHDVDLPRERSVAALRVRAHELLDAAYARRVRCFEVARSYGRAEEFLSAWLDRRDDVQDAVVGSKWGYTYTADWRVDAGVHEVKDHSVASFDRQWDETWQLLHTRVAVYQVHSVTPESLVRATWWAQSTSWRGSVGPSSNVVGFGVTSPGLGRDVRGLGGHVLVTEPGPGGTGEDHDVGGGRQHT